MAKEWYKEHVTQWSCRVTRTIFSKHNPFYFIHGLEDINVRYKGHVQYAQKKHSVFTLCCLLFFLKRPINIFSKKTCSFDSTRHILSAVKKCGSLHNSMLHILICHIAHSTLKTESGSDCLTMRGYSRTCRIQKHIFKTCMTADRGVTQTYINTQGLGYLSASVVFQLWPWCRYIVATSTRTSPLYRLVRTNHMPEQGWEH